MTKNNCVIPFFHSTLGRGSGTSENGSVRGPLSEVINKLIYYHLL